jgi:hypothetical protein
MKKTFDPKRLKPGGLLITCSSHEDRCLAVPEKWADWRPASVLLVHYSDYNPKREINHALLRGKYDEDCEVFELIFDESSAVQSFRNNIDEIRSILKRHSGDQIVLDMSVFTKRHLLLTLNWIYDFGHAPFLNIVYTEPEDYSIGPFLPLSFGINTIDQVPGFSASPDSSRALHLVVLLGYEGERALCVFRTKVTDVSGRT